MGRADNYDVVEVGFNYRMDEPRAALLLSRMRRLDDDIKRRRELTRRYRELLNGIPGVIVPFENAAVESSSCYVMPIMLERNGDQTRVGSYLREHGIQTSILYPSIHSFTAYQRRDPNVSLPVTEFASRTELTLPLFSHMTYADQDRVVCELADAIDV